MRSNVRKAFTLVEILIVVVILGILAAIVIPQFTNASTEAQSGNISSQLQTIRSQIELFRVRNNGQLPDLGPGGTANSFQDLLAGTGNTFGLPNNNSRQQATQSQDPYMRSAPKNPRNGMETVQVVTGVGTDPATIAAAIDPASSTDGWVYNSDTGGLAAIGWNETTNKWFGQP